MTERLRSKNLGPGVGIRHDFFSDPIPLSTIKRVKAKYSCRFLCVLLCLIVKAIRKVLIELGEEVKGSCDVFTAMNVPGHPCGLENHYGHLMLPVSFDETDTATQINAFSSQLKKALVQRKPVINSKLLDIYFGMPSFGERKRVPFPPVVVVNVMGPPIEAKVYGKRILDLGFNMGHCGDLGRAIAFFLANKLCYNDKLVVFYSGVLFTSFSYNGMWTMGVGVHESVMQSEVSVKRFIEDRKRKSCRSCRLTCYLTIDY